MGEYEGRNPVKVTRDPCNKLRDIHAVNFGRAGGPTCHWKTRTCQQVCYGKTGTYQYKNVKPYFRRIECCAPGDYYDSLVKATGVVAIRLGKVGDVPDGETALAICTALKQIGVPFMWPTRAWREPHGEVWQVLSRELPGEIICSVDPSTLEDDESIPDGYPRGWIAFPGPDSSYPVPGAFEWCHHYPKPGVGIQPICNCMECGLCYASPGNRRGRPNIAFALHSGPHAKAHATARKHVPYFTARRQLIDRPTLGLHGIDSATGEPVCGLLTSEGWTSGTDDV